MARHRRAVGWYGKSPGGLAFRSRFLLASSAALQFVVRDEPTARNQGDAGTKKKKNVSIVSGRRRHDPAPLHTHRQPDRAARRVDDISKTAALWRCALASQRAAYRPTTATSTTPHPDVQHCPTTHTPATNDGLARGEPAVATRGTGACSRPIVGSTLHSEVRSRPHVAGSVAEGPSGDPPTVRSTPCDCGLGDDVAVTGGGGMCQPGLCAGSSSGLFSIGSELVARGGCLASGQRCGRGGQTHTHHTHKKEEKHTTGTSGGPFAQDLARLSIGGHSWSASPPCQWGRHCPAACGGAPPHPPLACSWHGWFAWPALTGWGVRLSGRAQRRQHRLEPVIVATRLGPTQRARHFLAAGSGSLAWSVPSCRWA